MTHTVTPKDLVASFARSFELFFSMNLFLFLCNMQL